MEKSNLEIRIEHIEKIVVDIRRDVKAMDSGINTRMAGMDARIAGMDARMARMEALMEGVSRRVVNAEQKAEKTENRLWFIVIAVIVAEGMPALITKILS